MVDGRGQLVDLVHQVRSLLLDVRLDVVAAAVDCRMRESGRFGSLFFRRRSASAHRARVSRPDLGRFGLRFADLASA